MQRKDNIKEKLVPTQKEKNIFFAGILVGLAGGVIGNFFVSSLFEVMRCSFEGCSKPLPYYIHLFLLVVSSLVLLVGMMWFASLIKPVNKK